MKNSLILFLVIFLFTVTVAQDQEFEWVQSFGSGDGNIYPNDLALDASGAVFISGNFTGSPDFDPGPDSTILTAVQRNMFVTKFDASGNFLWARGFGGDEIDSANGLDVDSDGNVIVVGHFEAPTDFDPGLGDETLTTLGNWDCFILKLDPNGNFLWVKQLGSVNNDNLYDVIVDGFGNIYVPGVFTASLNPDPANSSTLIGPPNGTDCFVAKFDPAGNFCWVNNYTGMEEEYIFSLGLDFELNIHTTGFFSGDADLNPGILLDSHTSNGDFDCFIQKLDGEGNLLWGRSFGSVADDRPTGILVDNLANTYTVGRFESTVDFDPGPDSLLITPEGFRDLYIQKLNPQGELAWVKTLKIIGLEGVAKPFMDSFGDIYINGRFFGTNDFDPGPAVYNAEAELSYDAFILKLDQAGNFIWLKQFGGTGTTRCRDIELSPDGDIYVCGHYFETTDFDPGAGVQSQTGTGIDVQSAYVLKLSYPIVSIENYDFTKNSKVHPNPTRQQVSIELPTFSNQVQVIVLDASGRHLQTQNFESAQNIKFPMEHPAGIYFLEISYNNVKDVVKLIKE